MTLYISRENISFYRTRSDTLWQIILQNIHVYQPNEERIKKIYGGHN